jgi:hypothetical protein
LGQRFQCMESWAISFKVKKVWIVKAWFSIIIGFFNIFLLVWWLGLLKWNLDMDSKGKNPHVGQRAQERGVGSHHEWWCKLAQVMFKIHLMMILKDITQIIYQSWKVIHSKWLVVGDWWVGTCHEGAKCWKCQQGHWHVFLGWRWVTCFFVWVELAQGRHCGRTNMVGHRSCMGG